MLLSTTFLRCLDCITGSSWKFLKTSISQTTSYAKTMFQFVVLSSSSKIFSRRDAAAAQASLWMLRWPYLNLILLWSCLPRPTPNSGVPNWSIRPSCLIVPLAPNSVLAFLDFSSIHNQITTLQKETNVPRFRKVELIVRSPFAKCPSIKRWVDGNPGIHSTM